MKTVGNLIKEARLKKNYTKKDLGEITHIRANFIAAIENASWKDLPEFNIVVGFVKSLAHFLDIPEDQAVSTLRRDYPPSLVKSERLKVKSENFGKRFVWGPRMTFAAGILIIIFLVLGYLGFQYRKFNLPPHLVVQTPTEGQSVINNTLEVSGKTDMDAGVEVNGQMVIVNDDGSFKVNIPVSESTTDITVSAKSRSGKETIVRRRINVHK